MLAAFEQTSNNEQQQPTLYLRVQFVLLRPPNFTLFLNLPFLFAQTTAGSGGGDDRCCY
jgi:hypothetical protein